jgi:hypothetical protein
MSRSRDSDSRTRVSFLLTGSVRPAGSAPRRLSGQPALLPSSESPSLRIDGARHLASAGGDAALFQHGVAARGRGHEDPVAILDHLLDIVEGACGTSRSARQMARISLTPFSTSGWSAGAAAAARRQAHRRSRAPRWRAYPLLAAGSKLACFQDCSSLDAADNSSSNSLASWRSAVSKPSVNAE